jgi:hypothetical protein
MGLIESYASNYAQTRDAEMSLAPIHAFPEFFPIASSAAIRPLKNFTAWKM